jgi:hypothetical protein
VTHKQKNEEEEEEERRSKDVIQLRTDSYRKKADRQTSRNE